jgi:3-methylcrotonyl-CoA carboxylase alpha subunit
LEGRLIGKIKRVAIANRGEVAVRIIRACEELGIETVLLHSEPDMKSRAYRMADKKICIGPAPTNESYLNIDANIKGALAAGADAIHPGFGFLSENADFAQACLKAGIKFIGPSPESIRTLGDKVHFKNLAQRNNLPLIPGYQGENQDIKFLVSECEKIGFPVIVKAAAGGGGRGMKLIKSAAEAKELIESAQREALSAFGSPKVFLEKYLDHAKHIEFQIFGDSSGQVVHLFDRECSVQRRHQKIIEEALSPSLTDDLRREMGQVAVTLGELGKYQGAGTVEFLLQDGKFYLLEVNTRLQVEHPVTELVMGVDLVKAQILTAAGEYVFDPAKVRAPRGHSIECRLYAENPYLGGIPSTGILGEVMWPEGPGRRYEYGFEKGDEITSYYDPMIAKVITWDENRSRCIQKTLKVLSDSVIFGVRTNIPYLMQILSHPEFISGKMTTRFIEKYFANPLEEEKTGTFEKEVFEKAMVAVKARGSSAAEGSTGPVTPSPWSHFAREE